MKPVGRFVVLIIAACCIGLMLLPPASAEAQYPTSGDGFPLVVTAGATPLGDSYLFSGGVGVEVDDGLYALGGGGFGSAQTENEHGIPIEQEFTSYGVGVFYELSDAFSTGRFEDATFLVGGAAGMLETKGQIPGADWSGSRSTPFVAVLVGIKFGPAILSGGVGTPLD